MSSTAKAKHLLDMCQYKDDGTPVYPPEDLEYYRIKSTDGDDGEWRLVTVEWCHVFGNGKFESEYKDSLVKGYGRITFDDKHPEVFYEFAYWNKPDPNPDLPADEQPEPFWESAVVHWEHTWQNFVE